MKILLLIILLLIPYNSMAKVDYKMPENIKVGIYYGSKALSTAEVQGNDKTEAGYYKDGKFTSLYALDAENKLTISKSTGSSTTLIGTLNGTQVFTYDTASIPLTIRKYETSDHVQPVTQPEEQKTDEVEEGEETVESDSTEEKIETATAEDLKLNSAVSTSLYLITIQGKQYRGELNIGRYSESDMTVVSVVNMEDYLSAVVPAEIGSSSPKEAIKAQGIAAKNFVLDRLNKYSKWGFDVTNTTSDQVYEAYDKSRDISSIINELKGEVLTYNGEVAKTFFFSTSGGYTANVKDVWGSDYPYLVAVEDKYEDPKAPKANWEVAVTPKQWAEKLTAKGYNIGDIKDVKIAETDKVGRVIKLEVIGTNDTITFERERARISLGIDGILSQWYTITKEGELIYVSVQDDIEKVMLDLPSLKVISSSGKTESINNISTASVLGSSNKKTYSLQATGVEMYRFNGKGWGHGVGMSQMGAIGMANAGFNYKDILKWYFTGTEISNLEGEI